VLGIVLNDHRNAIDDLDDTLKTLMDVSGGHMEVTSSLMSGVRTIDVRLHLLEAIEREEARQ